MKRIARMECVTMNLAASSRTRAATSDFAFNNGRTCKLREHLSLLFSGGRDVVCDTHAMAYLGSQLLAK